MAVGGPFSARSAASHVAIVFISIIDTENRVRQKKEVNNTTHTVICPSSKLLRESAPTRWCGELQSPNLYWPIDFYPLENYYA